jgi:hypothetical protein
MKPFARSAEPSVVVTIALNTSSAEWSEQARVAFSTSADADAIARTVKRCSIIRLKRRT